VGSVHLRVREPWRLLGTGVVLLGIALWLGGGHARAALVRAWAPGDRRAGWLAAAAAAGAAVVGLAKGARAAGSADAYGYVSQALLWLKGLPLQVEPLAARVPWPNAAWSFSPLGYRPGVEAGVIVPTYPPGLPLLMAASAGIGGADAIYLVVPVLGAAAVWLTYLLGRRHAGAMSGAAAAVLLAASPVFLYQVVQPMSDVPVTAWWLLALWGAAGGRPVVSGAGAAAAILTRPNLAPVAALVLAAVVAHSYVQHRTVPAVLRAATLFVLPAAAAVAFLFWLNTRLYGSPLMSGYGAASELFALKNVSVNTGRYTRWLVDTQTPIVLLGIAAPLVAWITSRRAPSPLSSAAAWFGLVYVGLVFACYLPYSPFEEWWYLRFLLPALPVLLILASAVLLRLVGALRGELRIPVLMAGLALLTGLYLTTARARSAFDLARLESRYVAAGTFASQRLPENAILLSIQESGSLRMYGRRATVRFDFLEPDGLDTAVQFFEREGFRPYFALEVWEEAQFRDRFAGSSVLGLLDWPPVAEVGRPVKVRFYDPRDRPRFLAGEPVVTVRDSVDLHGRH
jgi:hypothetical protein